MAIPENVAAALADKPEALAFVKSLDEKAGKLTPEVEADLPKLGEYKTAFGNLSALLKDTGAADHGKLMEDFKAVKAVNADLIKQRDAWKKDGKGVESPEYLALQEKLDANAKELETIKGQLTAEAKAKETALVEKRETDLKSAVIGAASKGKARDPEEVFILLKAKGLVGHGEDGKPFYRKLNEQKQQVAVDSADALLTWFLEGRKDLVSGSGTGGTGGTHQGGAGENAPVTTSKEARAAFMASRKVV